MLNPQRKRLSPRVEKRRKKKKENATVSAPLNLISLLGTRIRKKIEENAGSSSRDTHTRLLRLRKSRGATRACANQGDFINGFYELLSWPRVFFFFFSVLSKQQQRGGCRLRGFIKRNSAALLFLSRKGARRIGKCVIGDRTVVLLWIFYVIL